MTISKQDLRVTKTKKKLFDTFTKLLEIMELERISINELCAFSGIRRATFYRHFADKTDFFLFVIDEFRRIFNSNIWRRSLDNIDTNYYVEYARNLIDFIDSNEKTVDNIISSEIFASILHVAIQQNCKETTTLLKRSEAHGLKLPVSAEIASITLVGSVTAAILSWLKSKKEMQKEQFKREVVTVIERILGI